MSDTNDPVTPIDEANPWSEDEQPDESFVDDASPSDPPVSQPTSDGPDAAYKGLQRVLEREKAKTRELEARVQQLASQPSGDSQTDAIAMALIQEIAKIDPEKGNELALHYQAWSKDNENKRLRTRQQESEQARMIREANERNMEELRGIAADIGADPDSPLIDYGSDDEWIAERITKVRKTAREAAKPVTPVRRPQRTVDQQHNTQTGAPPTVTPANTGGEVTEAMLQAAQSEYARAMIRGGADRAAAEAKLRDLSDRFAAQIFA